MKGFFSLRRLFTLVVLIYILATAFAHFYADRLIFLYHQSSYDEKISGLKILKAKDGTRIATRFWKADKEKALILYFHGNYMDMGHLDDIAGFLNGKGYSVLAMDYRGYGLSEGEVKESNAYTDAQLVYEYALKQGYKSDGIIILGRSVGSGIATELAFYNEAKSLVLISPFLSTYRVMTKYPIFLFDKFNNIAKMSTINTPLFIVHGSNDRVIPAWHSQKLMENHQGRHERILIHGAGHNDIYDDKYLSFIDEVDSFLN
jgi:alpha-beta hydrolase superfamily lysophospholipase